MHEFDFDKRVQRYRYRTGDRRGEFVSRARVEELTESYIEQQKDRMVDLTEQLLANQIDAATFETEFMQTLKHSRINSYSLGRGGIKRLSQSDYGRIGRQLKDEYALVRGFVNRIQNGQMSEAQIRNNARQYQNNLWSTYQLGRKVSHEADAFLWEYNDLEASAEHCSDCLAAEAMGWVPIGTHTHIGKRECGASDRCTMRYSKAETAPTNNLRFARSLTAMVIAPKLLPGDLYPSLHHQIGLPDTA